MMTLHTKKLGKGATLDKEKKMWIFLADDIKKTKTVKQFILFLKKRNLCGCVRHRSCENVDLFRTVRVSTHKK